MPDRDNAQHHVIRSGDSPFDLTLRIARFIGLIGFLGGLAALAALTWLGPTPASAQEWRLMIHATRAIFFPCMFGGIVVLLIVGGTIWWRRRRSLNPQPWFRLLMVLVFVAVPTLHLWARSSMLRMRAALDAGDIATTASMWTQLRWAFLIGTVVFMVISGLGIAKPGSRRPPEQ